MNKNILIIAVLAILVVISIVQAVQLSGLKDDISSGKLKTGSSSQSTSVAGGSQSSGAAPTSLQNLPNMVGGC